MREDLETKVTGETLSASEWTDIPNELKSLIEGIGLALSGGDLSQIEKAIAQYVGTSQFMAVGGSSTVITLAAIGSKQAPIALQNGLLVRWRPGQSCPGGAITLNVGGLGAKSLTDEAGVNLGVGVYDATKDAKARYDLSGDRFHFIPEIPINQGVNLIENSDAIHWSHLAEQDLSADLEITAACTRPTGGNADYDIPIDRYHLVTDGDDVVDVKRITVRNSTLLHATMRSAIQLTVGTANKKFGVLQNIEASKCGLILNEQATVLCALSFRVGTTALATHVAQLKAAVISSTAGADDLTVTPISTWNANGTNPTLVAGQVFENTPAALPTLVQGAYVYYTIGNIDVTATNVNNLRVIVWIDDPTLAVGGDDLLISQIKLEPQGAVSPWIAEDPVLEGQRCARQYQHLGAHSSSGAADGDKVWIGTGGDSTGNDTIAYLACPMPYGPMAREPDPTSPSPNGFGIDVLGDLTFMLGDDAANFVFRDTTAVQFDHADHRMGVNAIRGRATVDVNLPGDDNDPSWAVLAGGAVDADGFFNDGIHVRTKI